MGIPSEALPGLKVELDNLVYHHDPEMLPPDRSHAFIYFLTVHNLSGRTVTLLGRKWVVTHGDGSKEIIEGDKIVGKTPILAPGESWSYNSYHVVGDDCVATGSFQGIDDAGNPVYVSIPEISMNIPDPA